MDKSEIYSEAVGQSKLDFGYRQSLVAFFCDHA